MDVSLISNLVISLSADDSRDSAIEASVEGAGAFRKNLDVSGAADVLDLDFEQGVILVVAYGRESVEDGLFRERIAINGHEEIPFIIAVIFIIFCHCSSLNKCFIKARHFQTMCARVAFVLAFILRVSVEQKE